MIAVADCTKVQFLDVPFYGSVVYVLVFRTLVLSLVVTNISPVRLRRAVNRNFGFFFGCL